MVSRRIAGSGRKVCPPRFIQLLVLCCICGIMFNWLRSSKMQLTGVQKCIPIPTPFSKGVSDETVSKIYQVIHNNQASPEEDRKVHGGGGTWKFVYGDIVLKHRNRTSHTIKGLRDPADRFQLYDYNFANKRYVEFGSNSGHNLFHVQHELKWGVGFEYNSGYVNIANFVKENMGYRHVFFWVYDLMKKNPSDALAYLPENTVDVSVIFAINRYLSNEVWGSYLDFLLRITEDVILIEVNCSPKVWRDHKHKDCRDHKHYEMLKSKCGVDRFEDLTNKSCCLHRRLTICRLQKKQ